MTKKKASLSRRLKRIKPSSKNDRPANALSICESVLNEVVTEICDAEISENILNNIVTEIESRESVSSRKLRHVVQRTAAKEQRLDSEDSDGSDYSDDEDEIQDTSCDDTFSDSSEDDNDDDQQNDENPFVIVDIRYLEENLQSVTCCKTCGSDILLQVQSIYFIYFLTFYFLLLYFVAGKLVYLTSVCFL